MIVISIMHDMLIRIYISFQLNIYDIIQYILITAKVFFIAQLSKTSMASHYKQRKKRTVNNPIVDISCVNSPPGKHYIDWIRITKQKLQVFICNHLCIILTFLLHII